MENYPLVTVFTLIYNTNPQYVIEAIESVIANQYPNIQHIIIDDCSPDSSSKEMVKSWIEREEYKCEFYEHKINYGICKTFNHVLDLARGEYLIGCSDDLLMPNAIRELLNIHISSKNVGVVFGDLKILRNGIVGDDTYPTNADLPRGKNVVSLNDLLRSNCVNAIGCMISVKALKSVGGFENWIFEDYPMWIKLILNKWQIVRCNQVLAYYRIHNNNISHNFNWVISDFTVLSYFKQDKRVNLELIKRLIFLYFKNRNRFKKCLKIYLQFKSS